MSPSDREAREAVLSLLAGTSPDPVRLPMLTGSMAWAILPGDILVVRAIPGIRVHLGDVAVFWDGGSLTAHRVIGVFRWGRLCFLWEKGDQNRFARRLNQAAVVGKVVGVERDGVAVAFERGSCARRTARRNRWRLLLGLSWMRLLFRMVRNDG